MNAIQELRREAKKHGTLKSNDQIKVTDKHGYISIDEKDPESKTVYVPAYDPWVAYGYPITPWPGWVAVPGVWWDGPGLYFGIGFGLAPFWGFGWGWPYWGVGLVGKWNLLARCAILARRPGLLRPWPVLPRRSGLCVIAARPSEGFSRGFQGRSPGLRSGAFSGYNHGGAAEAFPPVAKSSFGGGFHGGGFGGGGFRRRWWRLPRRRRWRR